MVCNQAISQKEKDVFIKIYVNPNSSKTMFPSGYNKWRKCIEMKVISPAKDNKANVEIIQKISSYFNILPENVFITSGHKTREKTVLLKNVQKKDILKRIEDSINGL